jgi:hypothetical protein
MRLPPADEVFSLAVAAPGEVTLPRRLVRDLGLAPGEVFGLTAGPLTVRLDRYAELLAFARSVSRCLAWPEVARFLSGPVSVLGPGGTLAVPPRLLAVTCDVPTFLQVVWRGPSPELYLFQELCDAVA